MSLTKQKRQVRALEPLFYEAAMHLVGHMRRDGWAWSSNYLREYVRVRYHAKFSNSLSPLVLREVIEQHPELSKVVVVEELKSRKKLTEYEDAKRRGQRDFFDEAPQGYAPTE